MPEDDLRAAEAGRPARGVAERLPSGLRRLLDADRVRLLGRLPARARVIDVGAGRGRLVRALRDRGHDAVGLEPAPGPRNAAANAGIELEPLALESAEFPNGEADAVVFWHVIEHLDGPGEALARAARWLRPGGRLVVAVPNLDSVQAQIGGDRWFHQDVPRHRTQFTLRGVELLLARTGFGLRRIRQAMLEQNLLGLWLTLLNLLTAGRDVPFRALKRDLLYARRRDAVRDVGVCAIAGPLLVPIAAAAEAAATVAGRAGSFVAHAEVAR